MRLINCETLELEEFFGSNIPRYAILSHTWGDEEVTFAHLPLTQHATKSRAGYRKIEYTCRQAQQDGLEYSWVDTCCIDKSSSTELSEAINSMYAWYKNSAVCYAILTDVSKSDFRSAFPKSRWFTRGWTLQELIAPARVLFFDRDWEYTGQRSELAQEICKITAIDRSIIEKHPLAAINACCIAKRMS
jgi:hypothetical protein